MTSALSSQRVPFKSTKYTKLHSALDKSPNTSSKKSTTRSKSNKSRSKSKSAKTKSRKLTEFTTRLDQLETETQEMQRSLGNKASAMFDTKHYGQVARENAEL